MKYAYDTLKISYFLNIIITGNYRDDWSSCILITVRKMLCFSKSLSSVLMHRPKRHHCIQAFFKSIFIKLKFYHTFSIVCCHYIPSLVLTFFLTRNDFANYLHLMELYYKVIIIRIRKLCVYASAIKK